MRLPAHALPDQAVWIGAGLVVLLVGAAVRARRRQVSVGAAFAFAGWVGVAGCVGARLLWVLVAAEGPVRSGASWMVVFTARGSGFASFGGLAAAGLAAVAVRHRMEEAEWWRSLDVVGPAGFLGLAVARVGCLAAGCDFGRPTGGSWGLRYPLETPAHMAHVAEGWIEPSAPWSLPTHPFPFYLVVVTVAAVLVGSRCKSNGAEAGAVATAYCAGRLLAEFFRSPQTDIVWFGGLVGLNQLWAAIGWIAVGYVTWRRCA